jgi:CheY-like chemotaxis protein
MRWTVSTGPLPSSSGATSPCGARSRASCLWRAALEDGGESTIRTPVPAPTRILVVDDSPTIRRVVGSVLQRAGFDAVVVPSGEAALDECRVELPGLLLVDVTMPGMSGEQFILRVVDEHPDSPPIVLLCARGDQIAPNDPSLRARGVVDAITKPFSPEALLALVQHTVEKHGAGRRRAPDRTRVIASLADIPVTDPMARVRSPAHDFDDDEKTAPAEPRTTLNATSLGARGAPQQSAIPLPDGVGLMGDLSVIALPEVLQLLKFQSHTGVLLVDAAGLRFQVSFEGGAVVGLSASERDGAPTRRAELLLGHYFVVLGLVDENTLEVLLATPSQGRPLGERLLAAGHITADDLRRTLGEQVQDLMVELLRARRGVFALRPGVDGLPVLVVRPGWAVDGLMFEALRRIDEWGVIETEVPSFDACFAVRGVPDDTGLSPDERAVFAQLVRGPTRVADVVKRSPLRAFDVCRVLYRLAVLKRIRRVDDGDGRSLVSEEARTPALSTTPRGDS